MTENIIHQLCLKKFLLECSQKYSYGNQCDFHLKVFNRLSKKSKGHIFQSICLLLECLEVSGRKA